MGFQPVSLRNFRVLPKMIFSSEGRIRSARESNVYLHTGQIDRNSQHLPYFVSLGRAQIVGLASFSPHRGEVKSAHSVVHIQKRTTRLQISDLDYGRLQALFDTDQLSHKVGRCVVCLSWPRGVKKPYVDRRDVVIAKIPMR